MKYDWVEDVVGAAKLLVFCAVAAAIIVSMIGIYMIF